MTNNERSGPSGPPRIFKRWSFLLLGVTAIVLFVAFAAPAIGRFSGIRAMVTAIRESEIEAGAYFYTDVEKVRESELYVRHTFEYPSKNRNF